MSVMSTSGAAGSIYANRRKRGGKKTVSREGASKTARARGGMSPASNAGAAGRRARSFAPTEPLATPARRWELEKGRPRASSRTAAAATRAVASTARKPASAASKAKWGRLSTAAKALGSTRPASAKRINRAKAETAAQKKAPPAQSARKADQKAYARAAAGFAKKRAAPASPARKRRASPSGGKPSPRQGGYKKAAQAMRADVKKRTRTTNQRRASLAKSVGRGVRGPGLGGRR